MVFNQRLVVQRVDGVAVEEEIGLPGQSQPAAHRPIGSNRGVVRPLDGVQIKK